MTNPSLDSSEEAGDLPFSLWFGEAVMLTQSTQTMKSQQESWPNLWVVECWHWIASTCKLDWERRCCCALVHHGLSLLALEPCCKLTESLMLSNNVQQVLWTKDSNQQARKQTSGIHQQPDVTVNYGTLLHHLKCCESDVVIQFQL